MAISKDGKTNRFCKRIGMASASVLLAGGGVVLAQDENSGSEQSQGSVAIETVVVTAQFVEQDVQDTPIAITAISGEMLDARGITDTARLGAVAPNVQLSEGGSFYGNSVIAFIRGVGQGDSAPAVEPGVGFYIDDVFYSTTAGTLLDLLDIERVEILRGPQGTLTGKNSIGGAIKLFSRRPSDEQEGFVEVSMGNLDALKVRGATNMTLIDDRLYGRVSGVSSSRDGHVKLYDFGCLYPDSPFGSSDLGNGNDNCKTGTAGGVDAQAGRLALRWLASDSVEVNIAGDYVNDTSEAAANTLLATGPTAPTPIFDPRIPGLAWDSVNLFFDPTDPASGPPILPATVPPCVYVTHGSGACPEQLAALGGEFLNDPYASFASFSDANTGLTVPRENRLETYGWAGNIDWDITPTLQLQSITGYRSYEMSWGLDQDQSPVSVATLHQALEHEQWTQEIRLNGTSGDRLSWTLGGFYLDAKTVWSARADINYGGVDFAHGPDPINSTSWAVFANSIFEITDKVELAAGIRYSEDEKDYTFHRRNPDLTIPGDCIGPPGTPGNPPNCALAPLNGVVAEFSGDRVDYRTALSYFMTEDVQLYGSISTGYKSGGVNSRPFFPAQAIAHEPEELTTYEVGLKTRLFDNSLRLNGAVFFNDYENIVLGLGECSTIVGPAFGTPCFLPANAGTAEMWGAELEFDWIPVANLYLEGSVSWLDFEFQSINPATGLSLGTIPPFTPKYTANFGVQYDFRSAIGVISPRLDVTYQDDVYTEALNTPFNLIDSYTLVNAAIRWTDADEDWMLGVEVRNLTDKLYYWAATDLFAPGGGAASAAPGLPRTYMFTVRRNF